MKIAPVSTLAYFDCNATTPTMPEAAKAALLTMETLYGNPSSSHLAGLQAKAILEGARKTAGQVIRGAPERITFTSGATEAIQTAVFSVLQTARERGLGAGTRLLYGATEHKAVPQALHHWVKAVGLPLEVVELPVDPQGMIRLDVLRQELPRAALLCTMAVNNETGVIQDLAAIEKMLLETGSQAFWLVDCVQALGKIPLKLESSRIDYAPFSGHKLYAPKGIGFLYVSKRAPFVPLIVGGGQERGLRSGTENLPGIAAFGAVLELLLDPAASEQAAWQPHSKLKLFRDRVVAALKGAFPKIEFNTPFEHAVPTTINFSVPGFSSAELIDLFDSAGIRMSAGSACSSASVKPSHVLDAMGCPEWKSTSALRLSFGPRTAEAEVERGCQAIRESAMALQSSCLLDAPGGFKPPESLSDGVIQLRAGSTNSWIVSHRAARTCVVIDPCDTLAERIEHYIRCQDLEVVAILDTHSHADHESVRPVLQKLLKDRLRDHAAGFDPLGWPQGASNREPFEVKLEDGSRVPALRLGQDQVLAKLHTPGHTRDSQALLLGVERGGRLASKDVRFVFCGDTILSGGLGRTNFSISDPEALFLSLGRIQNVLDPLSMLCPAHDYNQSFATSMETETRENPLLALAVKKQSQAVAPIALDLFMSKKREIDGELERLEQSFQGTVCGVFDPKAMERAQDATISLSRLQEKMHDPKTAPMLVDVREPQESSLFKDWDSLGLKPGAEPRNVPLSRFVNLMGELAALKEPSREIVLICRTGARSLQAAKTLNRLGLARARSLLNGITPVPSPIS